MRYILFSILSIFLFACDNKEEIINDYPSFICDIDGNSFSSSVFEASINDFDMMSLNFSDNTYVISLRIYNFSTINEHDTIYFSTPGMGMVTHNSITYSNFYSPPYDGEIVFTDIRDDILFGTVHFKAQDVDAGSFINIHINNGLFENIDY